MGLKNPQAQFEDGIFGQGGMHPTPSTLPYPSQPLKTIYGETVEYLIPAGQKEKVLKKTLSLRRSAAAQHRTGGYSRPPRIHRA